jgi:hypothetical protein
MATNDKKAATKKEGSVGAALREAAVKAGTSVKTVPEKAAPAKKTGRTAVNVKLDPKDPNPKKTVERVSLEMSEADVRARLPKYGESKKPAAKRAPAKKTVQLAPGAAAAVKTAAKKVSARTARPAAAKKTVASVEFLRTKAANFLAELKAEADKLGLKAIVKKDLSIDFINA